MIDLSNPEEEASIDIDYYATQSTSGLLKKTAIAIKSSNYYTLGDFFDNLTGDELNNLYTVINNIGKQTKESEDCYMFLFVLTLMLLSAQGGQLCKVKHVTNAVSNLVRFTYDELYGRKEKTPLEMLMQRDTYDIDLKFKTGKE